MSKTAFLLSVIVGTSILTSCASKSTQSQSNPSINNTIQQPSLSVSISPISKESGKAGSMIGITDWQTSQTTTLAPQDVKWITVEGVNIRFLVPNAKGVSHQKIGDIEYNASFVGYFNDGARYGNILVNKQADGKTTKTNHLYYQGDLTTYANMPTIGQANYKGKALNSCEGCNGVVQGDANFVVNFSNKSLTGTISDVGTNAKTINVAGTISQNSFLGEKDGTKIQGNFFGQDASQLAGIFVNEKEKFAGAFGAEK